jgi:CubicO group peptidase (beta-lactamase class C family)
MSTTDATLREAAATVAGSIEADARFSRVTSVLFARGGQVVAHHTWRDSDPADRYDLFSVTKTVTALLTGIAIDDGLVALDQPATVAPRLASFPQLQGVTVRHLLTMTRGAETGAAYDLDEVAVSDQNWATRFAAAPRLDLPGTTFRYDNGSSQLLAEVLHHTTGDLRSYAEAKLFNPLTFDGWEWAGDPTGVPCGAGHLAVTVTSLAKVGMLLCRCGKSSTDQRLVSDDWISAMRRPATPGGPPEDRPYGMGLWIENEEVFFGAGWGGQLLWCRPRDELVVVALTDPGFTYGPPARDQLPADWAAPLDLIRNLLL